MASFAATKLACLVLLCMVIGAPMAKAAITCTQVIRSLTPCVNYVANGGAVSGQCCSGIRSLYSVAQTRPDRQTVCRCIKSAISGIPYSGFNLANAALLPSKCQLNVPYKIDPSTNCDQVQ